MLSLDFMEGRRELNAFFLSLDERGCCHEHRHRGEQPTFQRSLIFRIIIRVFVISLNLRIENKFGHPVLGDENELH